jgi:diaminopimelate decarboxylase
MKLSNDILNTIGKRYGQSFYILDSNQFAANYKELQNSFREIYPESHIAYSYKTNYIPKLCKIVNSSGGFAEVVSEMEYTLALKVGVKHKKIFFNGPYKNSSTLEELLINGGTVNLDSHHDLRITMEFVSRYPEKQFSVGLRCNFDINDGILSRFGFDVHGNEFKEAISYIRKTSNLKIKGMHCHFSSRDIDSWRTRTQGMLELAGRYFSKPPGFISFGGGMYGKMPDSLKSQFDTYIPSYRDYAEVVATPFRERYGGIHSPKKPMLIIEPGSALAADSMKFVAKVVDIKKIRNKNISTLTGSVYNINHTNSKNLPITVYHDEKNGNRQEEYEDIDFAGYTCKESDYLYRNFNGKLAVGDYIVFDNVGSYSIVLKPPFILPNFPVVDYDDTLQTVGTVKRGENFDDLFHTFSF